MFRLGLLSITFISVIKQAPYYIRGSLSKIASYFSESTSFVNFYVLGFLAWRH